MSIVQPCPNCGKSESEFIEIDAGLRLSLASAGVKDIPPKVCRSCYEGYASAGSAGVQLRAEKRAKEHNLNMLWKSRVNLIKQARQLMEAKAFAQAAVSYEKYIRVLEMVYGIQPGTLTPATFNNSTRSKELTVIASVYWDLVRIYDTSPKFGDRMKKAAKKLAIFLPYSTLFPDIIRKAEAYARSAKHPAVIRDLLRELKKGRLRCFIASQVFKAPYSEEVFVLRNFRDQFLREFGLGRAFIAFYYKNSPSWVLWIEDKPNLKAMIRGVLKGIAFILKKLS